MKSPLALFAVATLTPAVLILTGAVRGGAWILLAILFQTALTSILDRWVHYVSPARATPTGGGLSIMLALVHFAVLPITVMALAADHLLSLEKVGLFFAAGLFLGQVSHANAHELIHRPTKLAHRLGMWVYISILFGHHTSAHVLVHHQHVATSDDPNTSRRGEGFYRFMIRAWIGSFKQGFAAEQARLARIGAPFWRNPYLVYVGGAVLFIAIAAQFAGRGGVVAYIGLAAYAQTQLLMSDYVQHYALHRARRDDGKPVPVNATHSWNSPHWFSSALLLNGTRHSDHHAHPARPYPALDLPEDAPMLPKPLPLMAAIALVPPLWRRVMDPLAERWAHA
ncbi:alkane 1-monooxygenase [Yoonia sp. SS1-5]|uniref:Alkane 1-monooxygenase n=1 Tax=Yoonia rhodophyticola TaxID=3137370 RepID=A0AAN0MD50_9RHOB